MNPHPTHKIRRIKVVKNFEILYCDNCDLFATHPEIEQPCKGKPDMLAKIKRMESLNLGSMRFSRPLEDQVN